ncbi:hypothetical protein D3OALGA1CA_4027 [Olavius algarvensis associated proteobacterium Delta 3]|nr:hypothetical protein D3OALGB2SA_3425 [Olavius algarvensis associated proteobacterium Delta 3]CAB5143949.1 hypothetical protein D3OALGA1CA_4027 [Olavius algarvensis associated proteobacterium Delta 3]
MRELPVLLLLIAVTAGPATAAESLLVENAYKNISLSGYTRSIIHQTISSEVSGKVLQVNYDIGQVIGEKPIIQIDPTFVTFEIETTRHAIRRLNIALKKSASREDFLKKEFDRFDALYKGKSTAQSRRDAALEEYSQATLESETISVEKSAQETRLMELMERKRRHTISAPNGWIVTGKHVEVGEIIAPDTPLAVVGDYRQLVVPLSVSANELIALQQLPEEFTATLDKEPVRAAINWINPEFDEQTRKLAIEVIIRNFHGEGRGGRFFSLALQVLTEGLRIPKTAVINRYDNPRVRIKATDEEISVLVLGESNDHVIVADSPRLKPGLELAGRP